MSKQSLWSLVAFTLLLNEAPDQARSIAPTFDLRPSLGSLAVFKKRPIYHKFLETGGDPSALAFPGVPAKDTYRVLQI